MYVVSSASLVYLELERMWKETAMICFRVISEHMSRTAEENQGGA